MSGELVLEFKSSLLSASLLSQGEPGTSWAVVIVQMSEWAEMLHISFLKSVLYRTSVLCRNLWKSSWTNKLGNVNYLLVESLRNIWPLFNPVYKTIRLWCLPIIAYLLVSHRTAVMYKSLWKCSCKWLAFQSIWCLPVKTTRLKINLRSWSFAFVLYSFL